jgi:dinuclear metal center YbgI/SA1388 family protein
VLDLIEEIAPFSAAEDWDNSGMQVGSPRQKIDKILVALDPTRRAVDRASKRQAQLLLTHHPLIFTPLKRIDWDASPGNIILTALRKGIAIVSVHTNLDIAQGGINDKLAQLFGLQNVEILQPCRGLGVGSGGLGRIGELPKPSQLSDVVVKVKKDLGSSRVGIVGKKKNTIRRVAVVGGSGGAMVSAASERGADLLITGDVRHHDALKAAELDLAVIDGGHFHTERSAMKCFLEELRLKLGEAGWDVAVEFYGDEKNPLNWE